MRNVLPILVAAGLAGCAATPAEQAQIASQQARTDAKLAKALQGLTPGAPQDCLNSYELRNVSSQAYGDTLLYRVSSSKVYRNDTSGGCFGLDRGDALIDKSYSSQMCRGDILQSRDLRAGNIPSGSCTRGTWVLYSK